MSTVLIVDDEVGFLDELMLALSRDGHIVMTATNAREAIDTGSRYRPDVLVTDWMLQDHIHGLDVADVLKVVAPNLQIVLMTGYASADLEADAAQRNIAGFLRKPFNLSQIRTIVKKAIREQLLPPQQPVHPIGVVEINPDGAILYANTHARKLFSTTRDGDAVSNIKAFIADEDDFLLTSKTWIRVSPGADDSASWFIRSTEWSDIESRLCVILDYEDRCYQDASLTHLLLGTANERTNDDGIVERIIVVEEDPVFRRRIAEGLHKLGCICHTAESTDEALRLMQRDIQIKIVILDAGLSNGGTGALIRQITMIQPNAFIIGSGPSEKASTAKDIGFDGYLSKPWIVEDLTALMNSGKKKDSGKSRSPRAGREKRAM